MNDVLNGMLSSDTQSPAPQQTTPAPSNSRSYSSPPASSYTPYRPAQTDSGTVSIRRN
jgi:hypothetical protein